MCSRKAFVILGTGSDEGSAIHLRIWEVPVDEEALERVAATLTAAFGAPSEAITDDPESAGRSRVVVFGGNAGGDG